jgi:hypothetical protein
MNFAEWNSSIIVKKVCFSSSLQHSLWKTKESVVVFIKLGLLLIRNI